MPSVRINKSFFSGYYELPVDEFPAEQEYVLEIDSDNFHPGKNIIQLGHVKEDTTRSTCNSKCCSLNFHELRFVQAPRYVPAPPDHFDIHVSSIPSGADVFLDGRHRGTTPMYLIDLKADDYRLKLVKDGYPTEVKSITVDKRSTSINFKFVQAPRYMPAPPDHFDIHVSSIPSGADVFLDGHHRGTTSMYLIDLKADDYSLKLVKDGYQTKVKSITVDKRSTAINFKLVKDLRDISISSTPPGAALFIDGQPRGTTPKKLQLPLKSHLFEFKKDGYETKKERITIDVDSRRVSRTLDSIQFALTVKASQPAVTVYINGKDRGKTPLNLDMGTGSLKIKLVKSGYETIEVQEEISADTILKFNLIKEVKVTPPPKPVEKIAALQTKKPVQKKLPKLEKQQPPVAQTVQQKNSQPQFGNYHGLIIGNNKYRNLPKLQTAVNDATGFAKLLSQKYGFKNTVLIDASRKDILLALNHYRKKLTAEDNLLIYYAGHGWLDDVAEEGYWLPVDAEKDNQLNWISNSSITTSLRALQAKHVLVIADSCYSGTLTRGIKIVPMDSTYALRMAKKKVRSALTSGGLEPVADGGIFKDHSIFAKALIDTLEENKKEILDASLLFDRIKRPVQLNSDQTPEFSDIRKAGHDGGDFLFIRR
ncbi:MAG: PEGA domain-containing protein [Thermodesulfobacteriota bacterium]